MIFEICFHIWFRVKKVAVGDEIIFFPSFLLCRYFTNCIRTTNFIHTVRYLCISAGDNHDGVRLYVEPLTFFVNWITCISSFYSLTKLKLKKEKITFNIIVTRRKMIHTYVLLFNIFSSYYFNYHILLLYKKTSQGTNFFYKYLFTDAYVRSTN